VTSDSKYLQLARNVETAIESGQLARGSRLPSVRELMKQHSLSLATVTSAYRWLEQKGLIEARLKSGYFVRQPPAAQPVAVAGRPAASVPTPWSAPADLFPQQRLQRLMASAVRRHPAVHTDYVTDSGLVRLRVELARRCAEFGCFLRADQIIVTQGATEALALALRAATTAGDAVAIAQPAHPLFLSLLESLALTPVFIGQPIDGAGFVDELQVLRDQHPRLAACLLMTNFEFPSGRLMPLSTKRALVNWASQQQITIIEDDVFGDLQHDGPRPLPLKSFDRDGSIIYVNSCSKTTAPGLRLGWIAAGRWQQRIQQLKLSHASSASALSQTVLHDFLAQGSHLPHLRKLRQSLRERCEKIHEILQQTLHGTCQWQPPRGGFAFWLELPATLSASAVREQLADSAGTLVHWLPGNDRGFYINGAQALDSHQHQQISQFASTLRALQAAG
jgi:DNA-binding transcriptional MocR family regulator